MFSLSLGQTQNSIDSYPTSKEVHTILDEQAPQAITTSWTPSFTYQFNAKTCTYSFTNTSVLAQDIAIAGWLWDFGDVDSTLPISKAMHQVYQYSMQGRKHKVSLQLIFAGGLLSTPYEVIIDVPHCIDCSDSTLAIEVVSIKHAAPRGSIQIRAKGGVEGFSMDDTGYLYIWNTLTPDGQVGACFSRHPMVEQLIAGIYEVQVTDGMGCKVRKRIDLRTVVGDELSSYK